MMLIFLWHSFSPSKSTEVGGVVSKIGLQAKDQDMEVITVKVCDTRMAVQYVNAFTSFLGLS